MEVEVARVFGAFLDVLMDLEARTLPETVDLLMLYRTIRVSGAESMKIVDFMAEEGSNFHENSG